MNQKSVFLSSPAQITGALGYTSEIFWHFFGRGRQTPESKLELLKLILDAGKLSISPPGKKEYVVKITPPQPATMDQDAAPSPTSDAHFAEPNMVCLADIPIHCLPIHSQRYHRFAFGFSKEKLLARYSDQLRTVMLFKTEWALKSLRELQSAILKKRSDEVYEPSTEVGKFLKFEHSENPDECFENIYLEREWRCLQDVELSGVLELVIVPRAVLETTRTIIESKVSTSKSPVSVLAWESLFGDETEERK